ncbi:hypothetical protein ABW19_dt0209379 [Dactylella cylindrospora]|nr:hypothetical protein ABW19_dt0209379 [Dactylella cylindrospora]
MHNLSHQQRVGIGIIFGLGIVEIAFGISCIFYRFFGGDVPTAWMLTIMEQTWAVIVVCLPAFRAFVTRDAWDIIRGRRKRSFDAVEVLVSDGEKEKSTVEQVSRHNSEGDAGQAGVGGRN